MSAPHTYSSGLWLSVAGGIEQSPRLARPLPECAGQTGDSKRWRNTREANARIVFRPDSVGAKSIRQREKDECRKCQQYCFGCHLHTPHAAQYSRWGGRACTLTSPPRLYCRQSRSREGGQRRLMVRRLPARLQCRRQQDMPLHSYCWSPSDSALLGSSQHSSRPDSLAGALVTPWLARCVWPELVGRCLQSRAAPNKSRQLPCRHLRTFSTQRL